MVVGDLESRAAARTLAEASMARSAWQPAARLVPATVLLDTRGPEDWTTLFCSGFELVSEAKERVGVKFEGVVDCWEPYRRGLNVAESVPVLG